MTKTLADMTAEERADCVGMWALVEGVNLAVIAEADETNACVVIYPQWDGNSAVHLNEMVAPRHDLPRVWTPDGEPEDGAWEKAIADLPTKDYKGTFIQNYRRWVGEWEQDNE